MNWDKLKRVAEAEITATLRALPSHLQARTDRLPITLEPIPNDDLLADHVEPDTLGLFVGEAFPDGEGMSLPIPPQIILFLENLWDFSDGDEAIYREEIRITLLHELGHYLGLDELDLEDRGLD
ncbi:hypothetical protein LBMAG56_39820 [Verrucomicrobiota bacterium]|nr:hypothetical protein LBMAG56_39820 [Verrucomicrobiota bacterium]